MIGERLLGGAGPSHFRRSKLRELERAIYLKFWFLSWLILPRDSSRVATHFNFILNLRYRPPAQPPKTRPDVATTFPSRGTIPRHIRHHPHRFHKHAPHFSFFKTSIPLLACRILRTVRSQYSIPPPLLAGRRSRRIVQYSLVWDVCAFLLPLYRAIRYNRL
jgi:hypothetical protein